MLLGFCTTEEKTTDFTRSQCYFSLQQFHLGFGLSHNVYSLFGFFFFNFARQLTNSFLHIHFPMCFVSKLITHNFFLTTNTRLCSTWQNLYKVNAKKDEYVIPVLHTILICPFCSLAQGWCYFKKKKMCKLKKKKTLIFKHLNILSVMDEGFYKDVGKELSHFCLLVCLFLIQCTHFAMQ